MARASYQDLSSLTLGQRKPVSTIIKKTATAKKAVKHNPPMSSFSPPKSESPKTGVRPVLRLKYASK